jgi:hypothetical protein
MRYTIIFAVMLAGWALLYSCGDSGTPETGKHSGEHHVADDSAAACEAPSGQTIMDPNNPKPMALMMRQLAANADSMKQQILRGEKLDSLKYPFIRFYLAEPTDPSVLEPQFYENARLFQEAYHELFRHSSDQVTYHNLVISKCIGCHENYCSGPLKRIRKLLITP